MEALLGSAPVFVVLSPGSVRTFQSFISANVIHVIADNSVVSEAKTIAPVVSGDG